MSLVESGERKDPSASKVARVAQALGVSSEYLLHGPPTGVDPNKTPILGRLASYSVSELSWLEQMIGTLYSKQRPVQDHAQTDSDEDADDDPQPEDL